VSRAIGLPLDGERKPKRATANSPFVMSDGAAILVDWVIDVKVFVRGPGTLILVTRTVTERHFEARRGANCSTGSFRPKTPSFPIARCSLLGFSVQRSLRRSQARHRDAETGCTTRARPILWQNFTAGPGRRPCSPPGADADFELQNSPSTGLFSTPIFITPTPSWSMVATRVGVPECRLHFGWDATAMSERARSRRARSTKVVCVSRWYEAENSARLCLWSAPTMEPQDSSIIVPTRSSTVSPVSLKTFTACSRRSFPGFNSSLAKPDQRDHHLRCGPRSLPY